MKKSCLLKNSEATMNNINWKHQCYCQEESEEKNNVYRFYQAAGARIFVV